MKIFYTLLMVFMVFLASAQIKHRPDPLKLNSPIPLDSTTDTKLNIYFTIEKDTVYEVYWKILKDTLTWKPGWATYMCDKVLCYGENRDFNSLVNEMGIGEHLFEFHFKPYNIPGCTVVDIVLFGNKEFTDTLYRVKVDINGCISNTKNTRLDNLAKVYPNPASEYFQVSNSSNVDKIKLYNMFGAEVKTFFHYKNAQHIISDLKSGMYIVRLFDNKNKVIRTLKLNKVFSGA